jgi:16S rRNA (guanine(527)-N(7))-methyltransferase RsmG
VSLSDFPEGPLQELVATSIEELKRTLSLQGFSVSKHTLPEIHVPLSQYLLLLAKWNASHDLVAPGKVEDFILPHLIDSLASAYVLESLSLIPSFNNASEHHLADIGSGAGLPGIPWHILYNKHLTTYLVEPRRKRCSFLKEVQMKLSLSNCTVIEGRADALRDTTTTLHTGLLRALKPDQEIQSALSSYKNLKLFWLTGPNAVLDDVPMKESWQEAASFSLLSSGEHRRRIFMRVLGGGFGGMVAGCER